MHAARVVLVTTWVLLGVAMAPRAGQAQGLTVPPPGPFVIDIRGTTLGVPQASTFYPDIPTDTFVPARSFGLQAGAHVYPFRLATRRIGLGAEVSLTRGTATTPVDTAASDDSSDATEETAIRPDVKVTMRVISPEVSINFGTSRGWSYLTTGFGAAYLTTTAGSAKVTTSAGAFNAGAGARWFLNERIGVGFDLRFYRIGGSSLFAASAGFSLK